MKKILLLFVFLATVTFASAEVFPTLDVDIGVELVSSIDSVSADVTLEVVEFDYSQDYTFMGAGILNEIETINTTHFVPEFLEADIYRRNCYKQLYKNVLEQPPLETVNIRLSSCSLVVKQVSLRA